MRPTSNGKTDPGEFAFDPDLLTRWRNLFVARLRRSSYRAFAEDVATEMLITMMRRARNGRPFHPCPKGLPRPLRQEAFRIAQKETGGYVLTDLGLEMPCGTPPDDGEGPIDPDKLKPLRPVFTTTQIEKMVEACGVDLIHLKDLAFKIGMPIRTFRTRVREVRAGRPR